MKKVVILIMCISFLAMVAPVYAQSPSQQVECGSIVESEFTENQQQIDFPITLGAGDKLTVQGDALGDTLRLVVIVYAPNGAVVAFGGNKPDLVVHPVQSPIAETGILSSRGNFTIKTYNGGYVPDNYFGKEDPGGIGVFTLYVGCTLRDGTVINPGDAVPEAQPSTTTANTPSVFSGFGFPGVNPVDFSAGIEIPLALGQAQVAPVASDVALYTYQASTGEIATLTVTRVSGDISIGITVIKRDTNEIVFLGGLPSSNNLSVDLTFPSDGSYAIGLFRLDTSEHSATSGAVQITLQ